MRCCFHSDLIEILIGIGGFQNLPTCLHPVFLRFNINALILRKLLYKRNLETSFNYPDNPTL